jgi:predicted ATPase
VALSYARHNAPHAESPSEPREDVPRLDHIAREIDRWQNADALPKVELAADPETIACWLGRLLCPPVIAEALVNHLRTHPAIPDSETALPLYLTFTADTPADLFRLTALPWEMALVEMLAQKTGEGYLALHPLLHLSREAGKKATRDMPEPAERGTDSLRVLLAGANPATPTHPRLLHLERELNAIHRALTRSPECRSSLKVELLADASPATLQRALTRFLPDIVHLIAHGERRPSGPVFILQGEREGSSADLYASEFARMLRATNRSPLVVLSCCGTGETAAHLAGALLEGTQAGRPVRDAIVMQFPLRDAIAPSWVRVFYSSLADGDTPAQSLWQARQVIRAAGMDWAAATHWTQTQSKPSSRPRPTPAPIPKHNLPEDERPTIGREAAIEAVIDKLCDPAQRLVTITGIGGMGKSTLARACARRLISHFPGGVRFVELDSLNGREEIATALCTAWDIDPRTHPTAEAALFEGLGKRDARTPCLLVLDCFERHLKSVSLIQTLLSRIPSGTACLVTSRVVLGLPREFEYPLQPMEVAPEPEASGAVSNRSLEKTADAESALLFAEAATHADPDFRLTPENRALVETICRRLEGVPLSLTLAAGRLRYLSLSELLTQIEASPLRILRRPATGDPTIDRHGDLQEVINGSFGLLPDEERHILRQLSVFEGGFFLEDAQAVCEPLPGGDTLESLWRLREHSLVQVIRLSEGRTRYRLLDTVREYLSGLAEAESDIPRDGLLDRCRNRHAERFAALARQIQDGMREKDWSAAATRLRLELPNLRRAVFRAIEVENADLVLALSDNLARPFSEGGYWSDFDRLTDAALRYYEQGKGEAESYCRLLAFKALTARRRGAETEAQQLLERLWERYRQSGDVRNEADTVFELASQALDIGEGQRARDLLAIAREKAAHIAWEALIANTYALEAELDFAEGAMDAARSRCAEALDRANASESPDSLIYTGVHTGALLMKMGDLSAAETALHRAADAAQMGSRLFSLGRALSSLAELYESRERWERAALAYAAVDRLYVGQELRRRAPATAALARFRRRHGAIPEVQQAFRSIQRLPGSEVAARLLADPPEK